MNQRDLTTEEWSRRVPLLEIEEQELRDGYSVAVSVCELVVAQWAEHVLPTSWPSHKPEEVAKAEEALALLDKNTSSPREGA